MVFFEVIMLKYTAYALGMTCTVEGIGHHSACEIARHSLGLLPESHVLGMPGRKRTKTKAMLRGVRVPVAPMRASRIVEVDNG